MHKVIDIARDLVDSNLHDLSLSSLAHTDYSQLGAKSVSHLVQRSKRSLHIFLGDSDGLSIVTNSYYVKCLAATLLESELHLGASSYNLVGGWVGEHQLVLRVSVVSLSSNITDDLLVHEVLVYLTLMIQCNEAVLLLHLLWGSWDWVPINLREAISMHQSTLSYTWRDFSLLDAVCNT